MATRALKRLIDLGDQRSAFLLAWELFEQVRTAEDDTRAALARAFIEGRLKKSRVRGGTRAAPRYRVELQGPNGQSITLLI